MVRDESATGWSNQDEVFRGNNEFHELTYNTAKSLPTSHCGCAMAKKGGEKKRTPVAAPGEAASARILPERRSCRCCSRKFILHTVFARWLSKRHLAAPGRCQQCRAGKDQRPWHQRPTQPRHCVRCRTSFTVTLGEKAWLNQRNWAMHERCEACRSLRKTPVKARAIPSILPALQNVTCLVDHMNQYQKEITEAGNTEAAENVIYTLIDKLTLNQLELTGETKCQSYSLPLCALCEGKQPMTWIKDLSGQCGMCRKLSQAGMFGCVRTEWACNTKRGWVHITCAACVKSMHGIPNGLYQVKLACITLENKVFHLCS